MKDIPKEGAWSFDAAGVAEQFEGHVREQLPWYEMVLRGIAHVARHYVTDRGRVLDIGASTGNVGLAIGPTLRDRSAELVAVEPSPAMRQRWRGPEGVVKELIPAHFEGFEPAPGFDLVVMNLVLMFVAPATRAAFLRKALGLLSPGGALVVVDKSLPGPGYPATVMLRLALSEKLLAGSPPEEIVAKELSLAGVQRPIDPALLGPGAVEWFRFGDFAGWLVEK